ncbi:MAG: tRNA (adenosine(37)-N6)-threonylcarbamoyltransferase complex dimerization subunit type 1 TsaB [Kofleriaceae bacterium]
MIVLGIDTATRFASVAIVDDDRVIAETRGDDRAHGSDLLVLIDAVTKSAGLGPKSFDAVAIGAGPGSFTGLRIGMATAKGIAFAAKCPLWTVSSLAALAYDELVARPLATVCAVLDARKGEVYYGAYRRDDDRIELVGQERVAPPDQVEVPTGARIVGDFFTDFDGHDVVAHTTPKGSAVARLALAGSRADITVSGAPTYIRPSEAEVKYPDGVPGALKRR